MEVHTYHTCMYIYDTFSLIIVVSLDGQTVWPNENAVYPDN